MFEYINWNTYKSKSFDFYDKRVMTKAESNNPQRKMCGSVALQVSQMWSRKDADKLFVSGISGEPMIFKFSRYLINGS